MTLPGGRMPDPQTAASVAVGLPARRPSIALTGRDRRSDL